MGNTIPWPASDVYNYLVPEGARVGYEYNRNVLPRVARPRETGKRIHIESYTAQTGKYATNICAIIG